ncbi:MAG: alpha/beta fold hydrolase [Acidimicrobiia bacterium]|nr:alpha/beta fold hydrolase [Acidimicrobiia bacterium]
MPYADIGNTRLHIRQRGQGPVALFIHGFPLDSTMWLDQLNGLADIRRCIAMDLRGFGRSTPSTGEPLTMEQHAADLAAVLDLVSEEQADIVGLSMGGYVALAFAELYPDRLRSLALIDTRPGADSEEGKAGRDAAAASLLDDGRSAMATSMETGLLGPEPSPAARARLRTMIEGCAYETVVGALAGMRDRPDRTHVLDSITVPTAVIVGEFDSVTPPAEARLMADAIPDSTLTIVPGAGHLTPIEDPAGATDELRSLFSR